MIQELSPFSKSRRRFLVGLGASLALPLLPGCGLIDRFEDPNCGALDCTSQPTLEVDTAFRGRVERAAVFIRRLMHPDERDFPIMYQESDSAHSGGLTQPGNTPLYSGSLVVRLFLPDTTEASAQLAERMIVHEAVHAYDISVGYGLSRQLGSEVGATLGGSGHRLSAEELSVLDESTYADNPIQSNHGHPDASNAELLASTINVLRVYPESFLEMASELPVNSLERVAKVASIGLSTLVDYAHRPARLTDLRFNPAVIDFVEINH